MNKVKQAQLSHISFELWHDWEMNKVSTAELGAIGSGWGSVDVKIWDEICGQFVIQVKNSVKVEIDLADKLGNIVYCH